MKARLNGVFLVACAVFFLLTLTSASFAYELPKMVGITCDDGQADSLERMLSVTIPLGLKVDLFLVTDFLDEGDWSIDWARAKELQTLYPGLVKINSHSRTHPYFTSLTNARLIDETRGSKLQFSAHGINTDDMGIATPYGDFNLKVLSFVARYYPWHRAAWDYDGDGVINKWPLNDCQLEIFEPTPNMPGEEVIARVQEDIAQGGLPLLLFHEFTPAGVVPGDWQYPIEEFKKIVNWIAANSDTIKSVTISEALHLTDAPNLVKNYSFTNRNVNGWAKNWSRSGAGVTINTAHQGNFPEFTNSLRIVGGSVERKAWNDQVPVDEGSEYIIKMYQSCQNWVAGGWCVWVDEFNLDGYYIGGQRLGGNYWNFVGWRYYQYQPSPGTAKASIQPYVEAGSRLTLFVDSVEMRKLP
ncbi:MAG: polysaccharide deacetylase family protein [Candidatus Portnoybacteria bacterium]|nr:polysaccharide deacetylase family protein [Candidatus Portnoybacteria bacterium]